MTFLRPTLLTLACLFAAHTGASDLPSLGDASSSIVSPQQEHQLGRAWLGLLRGQVSQLDDPRSIGESLKGSKLGAFWKYRVGDYRIVASIEDGALRVLVVRVGNRREVYR